MLKRYDSVHHYIYDNQTIHDGWMDVFVHCVIRVSWTWYYQPVLCCSIYKKHLSLTSAAVAEAKIRENCVEYLVIWKIFRVFQYAYCIVKWKGKFKNGYRFVLEWTFFLYNEITGWFDFCFDIFWENWFCAVAPVWGFMFV